MSITVLVDDIREITTDRVFRSGHEAMDAWDQLEPVECLYLDHDLGIGPDGYDVIRDILSKVKNKWPRSVQIVSSSPPGRVRIQNVLTDHGYFRAYENGQVYWRRPS